MKKTMLLAIIFSALAVLATVTTCTDTDNSNDQCIDMDGDGYGVNCALGSDCDDGDTNINAGTTYYLDMDIDTYGVSGNTQTACSPTGDYTATRGGDCDDSDMNINPDAVEVCDGKDNDCDGATDGDDSDFETAPPTDNQEGVCNGCLKVCSGSSGWQNDYFQIDGYEFDEVTLYDSIDNDCDGVTDE